MTERVPVWVVQADPVGAAAALAPERTCVDRPPDPEGGYDLRDAGLVWPVVVTDASACAAVLHAVQRGIAVVVQVLSLPADVSAQFLDDLHRAAGGPDESRRGAASLSDDQLSLLRALAEGATLAAAARHLGIGVRSASRRLADARDVLGVETTAEAVMRAMER